MMYVTVLKWIVLILGTAGLIWWGASTIHDNIYNDGVNSERVEWQAKEGREASKRSAKVIELENKIRAMEDAHRAKIGAIETKHSKEIEDANERTKRDIAASLSGAAKLRWNKGASGHGNDRVPAGAGGGSSSVCNDAAGGELPPEITANLYTLANDADRNTNQLTRAQEVITQLVRTCQGYVADASEHPPKGD